MSLSLLIELTIRGSLVFVAAGFADRLLARSTRASWRRLWWLLVPLAFLAPCEFPHPALPAYVVGYNGIARSTTTGAETPVHGEIDFPGSFQIHSLHYTVGPFGGASWLVLLYLAGAFAAALRILLATWRVQRQWSRERFCTDPALLNLLEDAKASARISAPIGLIVSDRINTPALLGWLRPRILLPSRLADVSAVDLKAIFLHELAHFKALDIPLNWLFALVRVVHWFNPLAYIASTAWNHFVEEAADENAIRWMHAPDGTAYGEILLKTLGSCPGGPAPYGALAIGESIATLKRRILMIRYYPTKSNRGFLATAVVFFLAALLAYSPTMATADESDDAAKKAATDAMQPWLSEIDAGGYAKSWTDAAQSFQKALTSDKWVSALDGVRTPLGKSLSRKQASVLLQTVQPGGEMPAGTYVIAQFDSSFENLSAARETVCFQKENDGSWRAAGYFIKPR